MVLGNHQPNFAGTFGLKPRDSKVWLARMEMLIQDYGGVGLRSAGKEPPSWEGEQVLGNAFLGQDGQAAWGIHSLGNSQLGVLGAAGGPGWTPDPSPGCLLQHPAVGTMQAGTCPRSLACPGLLLSSAIICFL